MQNLSRELDALVSDFSSSRRLSRFSQRMIVASLKGLFSDQNDAGSTRRVEAFIRALSDRPEALQTIYAYYSFSTVRASLDKKKWGDIVRAALQQSIAHPRTSVYH